MLIIPAIDLRGGRCVRLLQGDYAQETVYGDDPVRVALEFHEQGAEWIHVVDLDGAKSGRPSEEHLEVLRAIRRVSDVQIEWGGGLKDEEGLVLALGAGATRIVLGSAIVKNPAFARRTFVRLADRAVAGIDARDRRVAVHGWLETSEVDAVDAAVAVAKMGARRIILTDIARDGMLTGPNIELLREVSAACGLPVIQSGGISSLDDLAALKALGSDAPEAVITGKAVYEGRFAVRDAVALANAL